MDIDDPKRHKNTQNIHDLYDSGPSLSTDVEHKWQGLIKEYRVRLGDNTSSDKDILERLQHIDALCRNLIQKEIKDYVKQLQQAKK